MKKKSFFLLTAITFLYFFVNFHRTAIPGAIFDELQSGLNAPNASYVTAIGAAFMYIYAFGQLLSGLMADRYGGARSILIGGALFAVGCLGAPFAGNVWLMYVLRAVTGLGASFIYISMIQVISKYCKENFTVVFGFMMCFGYAGSIVAGSPFVASVHALGWKTALTIIGVVILVIWALYAGMYMTIPKDSVNPIPMNFKPIFNVFKRIQNIHFGLYHWVNWGLYYTFLTVIGKKFLEDYCQMSPLNASVVITVMAALAAAFNFLSGVLSRLAGNRCRPFITIGSIVAFACYGLIFCALLVGFNHWILAALLFIITITANMSPVTVSWTKGSNPPDQEGVSLATMNFVAYLCVALISSVAGMLLEVFPPTIVEGVKVYGINSYRLYFAFATFVLLPGLFTVRRIRETAKV